MPAKDLEMADALVLASDFSPEEISAALRMSKRIAGTKSKEKLLDLILKRNSTIFL